MATSAAVTAVADAVVACASVYGGVQQKKASGLQDRGVMRAVQKVKLHMDVGRVFDRLGYTAIERHYWKKLG